MYVLRFDLYEGLELRMPPARGLEKIEVEIVWGNQKVRRIFFVFFKIFFCVNNIIL